MKSQAWPILVVALAGWLNRQQQEIMEHLQEENRVLREHLMGMILGRLNFETLRGRCAPCGHVSIASQIPNGV
jgi:hypothetical protein